MSRRPLPRWDDTFTPRALGDLMTQWGASTILVESSSIEGDPEKQALRRLNILALAAALDAITDVGDLESTRARHTLDTSDLFIVPMT